MAETAPAPPIAALPEVFRCGRDGCNHALHAHATGGGKCCMCGCPYWIKPSQFDTISAPAVGQFPHAKGTETA